MLRTIFARPNCPGLFAVVGVIAATGAGVLAAPRVASAQRGHFDVLHAFPGPGGARLFAALVPGNDGNFYGSTNEGGAANLGTIFRMTPGGVVTVLHSFTGPTDGAHPQAALIQATDGIFYGTTTEGGLSDLGTVFKMTTAGTVTVLHSFPGGAGGQRSYAALVQAADGNFYGTTAFGGNVSKGTVFTMTPGGVITTLHTFTGPDGFLPLAGLVEASDGNLYGTTDLGGSAGTGTAFRVTPAGGFTLLRSFVGGASDGSYPQGPLIQATDGNLYGTAGNGGSSDLGVAFRMTLAGAMTILHSFTASGDGNNPGSALLQTPDGDFYGATVGNYGSVYRMTPAGVVTPVHGFSNLDGAFPMAAVVRAADGTFFGTTYLGGAFNAGTIFSVTSGGTFTLLQSFTGGPEGASPKSSVIRGTDGNLYGATVAGGAADAGSVFKLSPAGEASLVYSFFNSTDGTGPSSALLQANDGNLYGSSPTIGAIFRVTPTGTFNIVHVLDYATEGVLASALIQANDGFLYGSTRIGGASGSGTAFKMNTSGIVTVLHTFVDVVDQAGPVAPLVQATDGNFYGTTPVGGNLFGTVFRMTPAGAVTILHTFSPGADGVHPYASLFQGSDGNLYGTTRDGGASGNGTIFRTNLTGTTYTILYSFDGATGAHPNAPLVQAPDGSFFGTTTLGGASGAGVIFRMNAAGAVTVFHAFNVADGANPYAGLTRSGTRYYGTTLSGGPFGMGVVFTFKTAPIGADFDGDAKADLTVYRPSTGGWYTLNSSTNYSTSDAHAWGLSTDTPVPGDYDGDGKIDPAVFRPSTGAWHILKSSTNYATSFSVSWGLSTDTPVPADYDGDGKTDPAVYRASTGGWFILNSGANYTTSVGVSWGLSADVPVQGDYDGDGKADPAIYRPSTGLWAVLKSGANYSTSTTMSWGLSTDVAVPGDYDGDGKIDPTVFRPSTGAWHSLKSSTNYTTSSSISWGLSTDIPVPGDFDGDGRTDPAVFRPSTGGWYILKSSSHYTESIGVSWGLGTDMPINKRS